MRAITPSVACVVLLAACGSPDPRPLVGTLERDRIELSADQAEPVAAVPVREGDLVEAGDVLVRLAADRVDARLAEARANRDALSARLSELQRGPRRENIDEARASLASVEAELQRAESDYRRVQRLREKGLVSQAELDQAVTERNTSRARREEAAARLALLLEGTSNEELDRSRAELRAAEARVANLEYERSRLVLRAPVDGWVDALPYETGERVPVGAPAAVMLASSTAYARIYVPEALRARVTIGQAAQIRIDGRQAPLSGRVRFISKTAAFTPFFALTERERGRLAYLTEVQIVEPQASELPIGIPVEVRLTVRE